MRLVENDLDRKSFSPIAYATEVGHLIVTLQRKNLEVPNEHAIGLIEANLFNKGVCVMWTPRMFV
jgi:hypothetical protein